MGPHHWPGDDRGHENSDVRENGRIDQVIIIHVLYIIPLVTSYQYTCVRAKLRSGLQGVRAKEAWRYEKLQCWIDMVWGGGYCVQMRCDSDNKRL